jgi:rubrerythrin
MYRQLYFELTGQTLPPPKETAFERPSTYCAGIQKALFGELGAVERYRRILFAMQNRRHINMLTEIITDELKHASKYNYLYAKNKCSS